MLAISTGSPASHPEGTVRIHRVCSVYGKIPRLTALRADIICETHVSNMVSIRVEMEATSVRREGEISIISLFER